MRKIQLTNGGFSLVDDADYDWLNQYMWFRSSSGYAHYDFRNSVLCEVPKSPCTSMHRLILGLPNGDKRKSDHRNHIPLDNQRDNLRICTTSENQHNRSLTKRKTSSQYKGVHWNSRAKKWYARIWLNKKIIVLGSFSLEKYAAQAYNLAAKKYYGEFAFLNKIA